MKLRTVLTQSGMSGARHLGSRTLSSSAPFAYFGSKNRGTCTAYTRHRLIEWGAKELAPIVSSTGSETQTTPNSNSLPQGRNVARLESEIFYRFASSSSDNDCETLFKSCIVRRKRGEPTAYIVGKKEFWGLDFIVSPATLIPRPDTEIMIDTALSLYKNRRKPQHMLDLGTGSGCILLSLLTEFKESHGVGVDQSSQALAIAGANARKLKLNDRVQFIQSDWLSNIGEERRYDLIVSNPPYIPRSHVADLDRDVRNFEPMAALDGGDDGLQVYRYLSTSAKLGRIMAKDAFLVLEVGINQAAEVIKLFQPRFHCTDVRRDFSGLERCLVFQSSPS